MPARVAVIVMDPECSTVGVPDKSPVVELRLIPAGIPVAVQVAPVMEEFALLKSVVKSKAV